jgi:hypothetical protein
MAFKVLSEPKLPTGEDATKGEAFWLAQEDIARSKMLKADTSAARRRYMDRISFCQIAALKARNADAAP